jgi:hypothetical protein
MNLRGILAIVAVVIASGGFLLVRRGPSIVAAQSVEPGSTTSGMNSMSGQIITKEREGLEALKNGKLDQFGALTADDAIMVDAQGPATKLQVMKNVAAFKLTSYAMEDIRFVPLAPDTGLISYKITEAGVSHGKEFAAKAYVSSVWTQRGGNWVCLFSQETAAK